MIDGSKKHNNITIELMFAGVNMFLAQLRLIKMNSEKGQKHIYVQEHKLYYYYNNFRGHSQKEIKYSTVSDMLNAAGVCFIVQKLKTLTEHRKLCQKNLCF